MTAPLVLPLRPTLGWRLADRVGRAFAVLAVLLLVGWPLAVLADPGVGESVAALSAIAVGPPAFYSLARVLRPDLHGSGERRARHVVASVGSSFGTVSLLSVWLGEGGGAFLVGIPAFLALVVSAPWAVGSLLGRALQTPVPAVPWSASGAAVDVLPG